MIIKLFDFVVALAVLTVFGAVAYLLITVFIPKIGVHPLLLAILAVCLFVSGKCIRVIFRR
jgi:O-antigen/teichoic acid export membrane protein